VSVIIPTRDRWESAMRALRSVKAQDHPAAELILVDDGSAALAQEPELDPGEARIIRHTTPRGVAAARNTGAANASGEWLAFLDDDDLWAPQKLSSQLAAAGRTGADFVGSAALMTNDELRPLWLEQAPPLDLIPHLLRKNVMPAGSSNVLIRRSLFEDLGRFDETLTHIADWDLWLRAAGAGRFAPDPSVAVACVQHSGNMAVRDPSLVFREVATFRQKHASLIQTRGVCPDGRSVVHWYARSQWRAGRRREGSRAYLAAARHYHRPMDLARAVAALSLPALEARPLRRRPAQPEWLVKYGANMRAAR